MIPERLKNRYVYESHYQHEGVQCAKIDLKVKYTGENISIGQFEFTQYPLMCLTQLDHAKPRLVEAALYYSLEFMKVVESPRLSALLEIFKETPKMDISVYLSRSVETLEGHLGNSVHFQVDRGPSRAHLSYFYNPNAEFTDTLDTLHRIKETLW